MLIGHEELARVTGYRRKADLRRYLKRLGIPFREGRGMIWTTEAAVTAALVGKNNNNGPIIGSSS